MMTTTGIDAFAPASTMLKALQQRQVSSEELTQLHLARIDRYNGALNAIVVRGEDPLAAARQTDAARVSGASGELLGLPLTFKESMNVLGLPTTVGVEDFKDFRAADLGAVPRAVLGAGAVLLGKTNVPPMLMDWQADNPVYGRTVNPWNADLTPGGSTGGGAAAVAAGLSPLEFGSDIGGSIRVPASFCGIFGHKPSETTVPRSGQFPRPSLPNAGAALGVQGPLARTAEDLELALRVIAGPEVGEDVAWRLQLPPPRAESLADFRVAIMPSIDWLPVSADILAAQDELASHLSKAGASVKLAQPESFGDMRAHHALYVSMLNAVTSVSLTREERERAASQTRADDQSAWSAAKVAALLAGVSEWLVWHGQREQYRAAYRAFFRDWDILLAPITLRTAFPHMELPWRRRADRSLTMIEIDGKPHPYEHQLVYPALATLCGQPATAFPVGLSWAGLPMGLQAIGPYLEDFTPIRFAALAAQEIGGYARPPGYDE
jgi:amidase